MRKLIKIVTGFLAILIIVAGIFSVYTLATSYGTREDALDYMGSDEVVNVEDGKYIKFIPKSEMKDVGIIYYPGGKVSPEAYAPYVKSLAELGYPSFIAKMPLNLAILNTNAADKIIEDNSSLVKEWIIIGHSLGGAMASQYAYEHPDKIMGLVLLGAYELESVDFTQTKTPVLNIVGSEDKVINKENYSKSKMEYENNKASLPPQTKYVTIEGGNHGQFGYYGPQEGDGVATIDIEAQKSATIQEIIAFMTSLDE